MEEYWEWLCSVPGLYRGQLEILLRCFGTPEEVWKASGRELEHLAQSGCPWAARVQEYRGRISPEQAAHNHRGLGIQFISHEHSGYPERLRTVESRPYGLFYRGKLPGEKMGTVAVVGARMCTRAGREMAEQLAREIVRAGGAVVSGAAYGIDAAAQMAALEAGGESYAVLGCGADRSYPAPHRALLDRAAGQGGVISEFPPGTPPLRHHFPARNRIISGLADAVAVVEARKKSGALITANYAAEQGRYVAAVPGRPSDELSEGCNALISDGAGIILSAESFAEAVFPGYGGRKNRKQEDLALAPAEKLVYSSLDFYAKSVWELEALCALPLSELSGSLVSLEMKGLARETARGCYARTE